MKRFNIVISKPGGGVEMYPMKEWLRRHPDEIPAGLDPSSTNSHQLRSALRKSGWSVRETEVLLMKPDGAGAGSPVEEVLGPDTGDEEPDISFALEYQLRDFIAQNLNAIVVQGRHLRLYSDPATGQKGVEFQTGVGLIDILAVDDAGALVVFELKRASSPDQAIGQLARYMGWVKKELAKDREVHGGGLCRCPRCMSTAVLTESGFQPPPAPRRHPVPTHSGCISGGVRTTKKAICRKCILQNPTDQSRCILSMSFFQLAAASTRRQRWHSAAGPSIVGSSVSATR